MISVQTFCSISELELDCQESRVYIEQNHKNITGKKETSFSYLYGFSYIYFVIEI